MSLTYDVLKDDVRAGRPIDFGFVTYVPERTCLWNGGCGLGVYLGPYDEDTGAYDLPSTIEAHHLTCGHTAYTEEEIPSYCPSCGARVIKEDA